MLTWAYHIDNGPVCTVVSCPNAAARKLLAVALKSTIDLNTAEGKHAIYMQLLQSCPFANVVYMLILWIKDEIISCTATPSTAGAHASAGEGSGNGEGSSKGPGPEGNGAGEEVHYFKGEGVVEILGVLMQVPESFAVSPEIIVNEYDKIAAVCNLFLFVLLRG